MKNNRSVLHKRRFGNIECEHELVVQDTTGNVTELMRDFEFNDWCVSTNLGPNCWTWSAGPIRAI